MSPRLLLFDLYHQGHHGHFVRAALEHWQRYDRPGTLDVVVSREFAERHGAWLGTAAAHPRVAVHPTAGTIGLQPRSGSRAVLANDLRIGRVLHEAVRTHRPDHVLLMYFDHVQASLARGLRFAHPVRVSGIYFRPAFHYRALGHGETSRRARVDDALKQMLLRAALANRHVEHVFCLDPYAVRPVQALAPQRVHVLPLPEAFEAGEGADAPTEAVRRQLGVEDGRTVLLLFGSLDPRKGVAELIEALARLPDALARRACLVMAGEATGDAAALDADVARLRDTRSVQVVHRRGFVPDAEMHALFGAADLVVLPYQRHVGSSGVLIRAAAAGIPVLGPRYGMLGARIAEHRLGETADMARPADLAAALSGILERGGVRGFDAASARALAAANTDEAFADTLFRHLLPTSP